MAVYAIGDIQGCFASLQALVAQLSLGSADQLWLCGDLINRGPKSAEVLRWAMGQGNSVVAVLGNHDLHLLSAAAGRPRVSPRDTLQDVLEAQDSATLVEWLRERPLLHRANGYVMVHAGLHPSWSINAAERIAAQCSAALRRGDWLSAWHARSEPNPVLPVAEQDIAEGFAALVGIRTVDAEHHLDNEFAGPVSECPAGNSPWFVQHQLLHPDLRETILFGHWAALGLHLSPRYIGLDSGCVWGNALTAIRLEDRKVFVQPAIDEMKPQ